MSYQDEANLAKDPQFAERLGAGLASEAKGKGTDDLPALVLRNPAEGARIFMPLIASSPGFGAEFADGGQASISDGEMLSAIQANWDTVSDIYFPPTEPVT